MRGHRRSIDGCRRQLRCLIWLVVLALLLAACADTDSSDGEAEGPQTPMPPSTASSSEGDRTRPPAQSSGLLEDRGPTCATHRYVVAPETTTVLTFEVALSPQQAAAISPGRLQFNDNRWQEIDVSPFFGYCRIESTDAALKRWVVDGRDFLKDSRERGKAPVFTSIGEVLIVWGPDGIGTITRTRRWKSAEDLGQLSPAQIAEQLAGATTIEYTDPDSDKTYTWTADLRTVEKTVHALIIELSIDTPAGAPDTIARNLSVGDDGNQWTISVQYSDFRNVFIVTGPGQQLTCLSEERL